LTLLRQTILNAASDPNIALALVIVGALWIYAEFLAPGKVIPGMVGSLLMVLGLKALAAFPVVPIALLVILIGLACFYRAATVRERAWTAIGAVSFVAGTWKLGGGRIHFATAACLGVPFALITSFLLSIAMRARRNKTLDAQA
jgi:membrane-bound serine protease (ClpP class)